MSEKTQPPQDSSSDQHDRRYVVRYGSLRSLGSFEARRGERFSRGNEVLVRSERGVDWGVVLSPMSQHAAASLRRGRSKNGRILRAVSDEDRQARAGTLTKQKQFFARAAEIIREHSLVMQPVDIELVFGGEKVVLYYLAETAWIFENWSRSWPGNSKLAWKCGTLAFVTNRDCWQTMATAANPSAATRTSMKRRQFP